VCGQFSQQHDIARKTSGFGGKFGSEKGLTLMAW